MAAPYHNLLSKIDRALVAYLVSKGTGTTADTFAAKRSGTAPAPCTICWAEKAVEAAPYSGTYICDVSVLVKTPAPLDATDDDTDLEVASDARVAAVFDALHTSFDSAGNKLADAITTAARARAVASPTRDADLADFTCMDVVIVGPECGFEENTDNWVDTLNLKITACPSNVS